MRKTFGLSAMFVLAVALLSSCTSQKNLIYLQGSEDMNGDILHTYSGDEKNYSPEYVLAEQDMLYIQITSTVGNEANALFNNNTNSNYMSTDNAVYLNSFVVDKEGEIGLPLMGKVYVKGLTVEQAEKYMEQGEFAKGSMLPKIEAAVRFARSGEGRSTLITLLDKAAEGIAGKTGTMIHS